MDTRSVMRTILEGQEAAPEYPQVPPRTHESGERYEGNSWGWVLPDGQFLQAFMSHPDLAAEFLADSNIIPYTTNEYGSETLDYEAAMRHAVEHDWIRTWGIHTIALPDLEPANWQRARRWLLREKPLKQWEPDEVVEVYVPRGTGYSREGNLATDYRHVASLTPQNILHWSPAEVAD